ncbi:MAG: Iron-sulfur cluster carrier protein [Alphaproteobacteria bacterium MarineAlpha11_Bin1]|nr:MAG: Iron-sulfur cluster carrier protein [Alphaproteobacteria bacterium MarineAlpha11_Bin1]|tara:strand:- start:967 stop:2082 length:1116 start_codon:yes stop_codon:yes gene_type:complete
MTDLTETEIQAVLSNVYLPGSGRSLIDEGIVVGLIVKDGHVQFTLEIDPKDAEIMEPVRKTAEDAVRTLGGVLSVTAVLAAHRETHPQHQNQQGKAQAGPQGSKDLLPQVGAIIAVASGKGGVGKSTTAANLAVALGQMGLRTAMLDADIYGPSLPTMMGITDRPTSADGKTITPIEAYGVTCMSIGFLTPEDTAMIWRGPMVMSALEQMMGDVDWGTQDVLVVDMPPGTGDAQLTMAQRVPLAGAVIVSTPQDLSLIDAKKGLNMFRKVDVPVLGIVENMSYFLCPSCGERSDIFAHGGAAQTANQIGVDFLGEIPLEISIREGGDNGMPVVASDPDGEFARTYLSIAKSVWEKVGSGASKVNAPNISFE